ncbi:MAG TPA: FAD-dependent oxidoreductase [Myxococcaceae bacterium]|nr:FAD-dependent oxidoreductase [Myxococcaceae bacterium]
MNALSRREFLTACLGAGAAAAACRRAPSIRFEGQLLGQSAGLGHRLRDGIRPPPVRRERTGVAILGAGMAGLSAAWRLERRGLTDFTVLELEEEPGGTSRSGRNAFTPFPWGAHYVPAPLEERSDLSELLREMQVVEGVDAGGRPVVGEPFLCRAPQERLFFAGAWQEGLYPRYGASAEDLRQLRRFEAEMDRFVGARDARGRRVFSLPAAGSGRSPELDALDRMSMAEFLDRRGLKSPRLRWYVEYACRDDYCSLLADTSAWAGVFYFASRVERPGVPASELVTWPSGNGAIAAHLAAVAGRRVRTSVLVTDVVPRPDGVEVHAFDVARGEAFALDAEDAVFALPQFLAGRLLAPYRERPPPHLASFTYCPWVVANLTLRARPEEQGFPLAWDNVLHDSGSLGYVVATHQSGRDYGPTVWTWYLPLTDPDPRRARELLLSADWKHWAEVVVGDLRRAHPGIEALIERLDVWRWGHAMVRPAPGLLRGGALEAARAPLGRLHFANTDLSGMALFEEAQAWGVRAADAILARRSAR